MKHHISFLVGLAAVLGMAALIWSVPAVSHSIYSGLRNKDGVPCCDQQDCAPAEYRIVQGGAEFHVKFPSEADFRWVFVPTARIQVKLIPGDIEESGENRGHYCGRIYGGNVTTYCAIVPPPTG